MSSADCPLCRLVQGQDRITRVYHEDHICVIADCKTCRIPMVVFKHHREWKHTEVEHCMDKAAEIFAPKQFQIRWSRRQIATHPHFHVILGNSKKVEKWDSSQTY